MKKFDLFLIIMACGLIGFGFYFSKKFKSDSDDNYNIKAKNHLTKHKSSSRKPTQDDDKNGKVSKNKSPIQSISEPAVALSLNSNKDQQFQEKYLSLKQCISSQNCNFSQEDPRSYELEIYKAINLHLQNLDQISSELKIKVLQSAAKFSDGYIKQTVLKQLIKDELISESWRDLVLQEYISHHNARLIPEAMEYLKSYTAESDRAIIHQTIFTEIANGSPKVANALAENLKTLLDQKSASFYKSNISNLEEGPIKANLNREIVDFEMQSSAG